MEHWDWWKILQVAIPLIISFVALYFTLHDRKARLQVLPRKGDWYVLKPSLDNNEFIFKGVVEVYNGSSRGNAIRGYRFYWRTKQHSDWTEMESEYYRHDDRETEEQSNVTPLGLAAYSGAEAKVMAIGRQSMPATELLILVELKDLFSKTYEVVVAAKI